METVILWGESPFVFVKTVSCGSTRGLDEPLAVALATDVVGESPATGLDSEASPCSSQPGP